MSSSPNWLGRYRAGRRAEVWQEFRQLGAAVRDSDLAEEAQLVCDEMAHRARQNIAVIVERLTDAGYRLHTDEEWEAVAAHLPPTAGAPALCDWLVDHFGAVPMTLLSWVRIVGDVWLVGTHPDWQESAAADPMVLQVEGAHYPDSGSPISEYYANDFEQWRADGGPDAGPYVLPLAPDRLHKANVSGGSPYGVVVPDGCVDGLFVAETPMPFVGYLNWVFANGGFPHRCGSTPAAWRIREALKKDLLPL